VMGTLVRCSAARGRASGPSRRGLRSSMRRFSGDMARPPHRESPPAVPGRDIWTHRGRLRSRGAREGLGRAPPARCSLGDASALAPQIPAGAALAEEAATASAGNAAISALFGAAVVVLTVLTGSVGYLTFVNWQDSRAEKEERRRFEQSEKDRQYQQQMAAYKGDKKRDKERKKATGRGGGSGFGA